MQTISWHLNERAHTHSETPAVVTDSTEWSWSELAELSFRLSSRLRAEGVEPGDRVALVCPNIAGYIAAWFAIVNTGAIAVTVNTQLKGDSLRYGITYTEPALVLIDVGLLAEMQHDLAPVSENLRFLQFEGDAGLAALAEGAEADKPFDGLGSTPLSIVFTSGTSGLPKAVLNCHEAYLESGQRLVDAVDITDADRIMVVLPLFHANPQVYAMMTALLTGAALVVRPRFSASAIFDDARRFRATLFTYVGSILAMVLARHPDGNRNHCLTRCVGGGCSTGVWTGLQQEFGIRPHELYGMSETAGWVSCNSAQTYRFGSCGKVRDDIELAVVDELDRPVQAGESGEIVMRPRSADRIFMGYWNDPAATQKASRNFWFHTGDTGRFDEDGFLYFQGRSKEIIRKGGENISPAELETQIAKFYLVSDAAVVSVPDPILGEEIKACIVASAPFSATELRRFLKPRVAKFMLPRYVQFLNEIPRTETQKIQRTVLQDNVDGVIDLVADDQQLASEPPVHIG